MDPPLRLLTVCFRPPFNTRSVTICELFDEDGLPVNERDLHESCTLILQDVQPRHSTVTLTVTICQRFRNDSPKETQKSWNAVFLLQQLTLSLLNCPSQRPSTFAGLINEDGYQGELVICAVSLLQGLTSFALAFICRPSTTTPTAMSSSWRT